MVYDVAKLAVQSSSAAYSPLKDMILYFKNKAKYVEELQENLTKLTAEIATFYSKKKQIDRVIEMGVSKERNDEYHILLTQIKAFQRRYNKILLKYHKHCHNLPIDTAELEAIPESGVDVRGLDISTTSNIIDALQARKPTIKTSKFFTLAKLSRDINKLHDHIARVTDRMTKENVVVEKEVEDVQEKYDDVDHPLFSEYVQKILSYLSEDENRSIGIVGPIGVGKTTVMKRLNNQLNDTSSALSNGIKSLKFEDVIWINYSKQSDSDKTIEMMQDVIMGRLKLNEEKGSNVEQNADIISKYLINKKYILLIDQVSSTIDLDQVGIHKSHRYGKVVVASSNRKIVKRMTDHEVTIQRLTKEDSFELFQKICGTIYDTRIKEIAENIVASCGGLPQMIKLLAMHLKKDMKDENFWSDVKQVLQSEFTLDGMQELGALGNAYKLVYDNLEKSYKECLLFVALFPRGHKIFKDYLVECWNAERFLKLNIPYLRRARERGATMLKGLTDQYLLENYSDMEVMMPVHFRKVALAQKNPGEENCITWAPEMEVLDAETWNTARRMSLIGRLNASKLNESSKLPESPENQVMSTLLLQQNQDLEKLGDTFFLNMKNLAILDLNRTGIRSLPSSISGLINLASLYLNSCPQLAALPPEIKTLKKLEVLDIRGTSIQQLPDEIGFMVQLRCLRLSFSKNECRRNKKERTVVTTIPSNIISRLEKLEELIIEGGCCSEGWNNIADKLAIELTSLEKLNTLSFHFPSVRGLQKFVTESKSLKNTETQWHRNTLRSFKISVGCCETQHPYGTDISGILGERLLRFSNNKEISSVKEVLKQASSFELVDHGDVENLSEFNLENTGALKVCILERCNKMSSIVDTSKIDDKQVHNTSETDGKEVDNMGNSARGILQCLEKLHLFDLQLLKYLWKGPFFPESLARLKVLTLFGCPELTEILNAEFARALSSLKHLKVESCSKIVEIVKTETPDLHEISEHIDLSTILPKIKTVELVNLPKLQSICNSTSMNWKSIRKITILGCYKLRKLASTLRTGKDVQTIKCEKVWWTALDLSEGQRQYFSPRCEFIAEQPLSLRVLHEDESFNNGRPADHQPPNNTMMTSNGQELQTSKTDLVDHVGEANKSLPLYKESHSKVDMSISTH